MATLYALLYRYYCLSGKYGFDSIENCLNNRKKNNYIGNRLRNLYCSL